MKGFHIYAVAYFLAFLTALSFTPTTQAPTTKRIPASNSSCAESASVFLKTWFDNSPGRTAIRKFRMRTSWWNLGSFISRRRDLIRNHLMIKMDHRYPVVAFDQVARFNGMAKYYLGGIDELQRKELTQQLANNNSAAYSKLAEILKSDPNTQAAESILQLRQNGDLVTDVDQVLEASLNVDQYNLETLKLNAQTRAQLKRLDVELDQNNSPIRARLKQDSDAKNVIKEMLSVEEIPTELMKKLDIVENFQRDINRFVNDADQLHILKAILEKKLKDPTLKPGKIEIQLPQEVAARLLNDTITDDRMVSKIVRNSKVDMAIDLKKINHLIGNLQKRANERGYEQAILIKELETAKAEIERFKADVKTVSIIPEVIQILERRLDGLFLDEGARILKPELAPPRWTWHKLSWLSLSGEGKALFLTKLPEKMDKSKLAGLYKYISSLSDAERRALGIHKVWDLSKWYNLSNRARVGITSGLWAGGIGASAGAYHGIPAIIGWSIDKVYWKRKAKEECAEKEGEAFIDCAFEYLQEAFPQRGELTNEKLLAALAANGTVNDPKIQAEIKDILKRRNEYLAALNRKENVKAPVRLALERGDLGSPAYKQYLIEITDEKEFYAKMFAEDQLKGYLMNKYPLFYIRPEVQFAVKSAYKATPELRSEILQGMKKKLIKNPVVDQMIDDLEEVLSARDQLHPRPAPDPIDTPKELSQRLHADHNEGHMYGSGDGPGEITITSSEDAKNIIEEIPQIAASETAFDKSSEDVLTATLEIIEELPPPSQ